MGDFNTVWYKISRRTECVGTYLPTYQYDNDTTFKYIYRSNQTDILLVAISTTQG